MQDEVTVRDLRNNGARVLERVMRGEALTVTRDGRAVAELRPLPRSPIEATRLLRRWRRLPALDPAVLRANIDRVVNPSL
jgi:prevent-host-death family protein